jgi:formylmethanofuran dehydrogenase subunit D
LFKKYQVNIEKRRKPMVAIISFEGELEKTFFHTVHSTGMKITTFGDVVQETTKIDSPTAVIIRFVYIPSSEWARSCVVEARDIY